MSHLKSNVLDLGFFNISGESIIPKFFVLWQNAFYLWWPCGIGQTMYIFML